MNLYSSKLNAGAFTRWQDSDEDDVHDVVAQIAALMVIDGENKAMAKLRPVTVTETPPLSGSLIEVPYDATGESKVMAWVTEPATSLIVTYAQGVCRLYQNGGDAQRTEVALLHELLPQLSAPI